jgi:hypothetical protein
MRVNYRKRPSPNKVKPKGKGKTGFVEKLVKGSKAVSSGTEGAAADATESSDARAIREAADAGVSIIETYKKKQASKSNKEQGTGGR